MNTPKNPVPDNTAPQSPEAEDTVADNPTGDSPTADNPTARALLNAGALFLVPEQPITYASGMVSPAYMDTRRLLADPPSWSRVITELCRAAQAKDPQVIAGVAVGGVPHSTAVARELGLPSSFIRVAKKTYGRGKNIEGADVAGRRVVLVEDVVTSGESSLSAVGLLREHGAEVVGCVAIASYGFDDTFGAFDEAGVELTILALFAQVLSAAEQATAELAAPEQATTEQGGGFPASAIAEARRWHADPHGWADKLNA